MIANSKGTIYYGMHFYPGVAEYSEAGREPYRVFLNEDTIRAMDPTFAGRPVFVMHVDGVEENVDELRKDADGWVIESFFNQADGKHWVKFLVVSEHAEEAIRRGMKLSNCYIPKTFGGAGLWNGVQYAKEITGGEYEHLAIVPNPRYEESTILTPDDFKAYNEAKFVELKRLANHGETGIMRLFKKSKVENAADIEGMSVVLPKSNKEFTIAQLVGDRDTFESGGRLANGDHMVDVGGTKMTLNELIDKHKSMCDELTAAKAKNAEYESKETKKEEGEVEDHKTENDDEPVSDAVPISANDKAKNEEDEEEKKKKKKEDDDDKKKNDIAAAAKKAEAKKKADAVRNAHVEPEEEAVVEIAQDQVARGKARYGS